MAEETSQRSPITEMMDDWSRHLSQPVTKRGKTIRGQIISKNQKAGVEAAQDIEIRRLADFYVRLKEFEAAGIRPMNQSAKDWISLFLHQYQKFSPSEEDFDQVKRDAQHLGKVGSPNLLGGLSYLAGSLLKNKGIAFERQQVEERLKDFFRQNPEIREEIKESSPIS